MSSSTSDLVALFDVEKAVLQDLEFMDKTVLPDKVQSLMKTYLEQVDFR